MNDQQINDMVSRFLAWRLPEDFNPDGGISFAPTYNTWGGGTARAEPVGTNLFSFDQAKQMVLHMLGEANSPAPDPAAIREAALRDAARLVSARCDAYVAEHGSYDYSTGSTEYPGDGAEWVEEWTDIESAILALTKGAAE